MINLQSDVENRNQQRIEKQYLALREQDSFCNLFLTHLGCRRETSENRENSGNNLYFDYNDYMPALMSNEEAMFSMDKIVECVINLIDFRLPLRYMFVRLCVYIAYMCVSFSVRLFVCGVFDVISLFFMICVLAFVFFLACVCWRLNLTLTHPISVCCVP